MNFDIFICKLRPVEHTKRLQTSSLFSPEQTRSSSSPVPVPDNAEIGIGENLEVPS